MMAGAIIRYVVFRYVVFPGSNTAAALELNCISLRLITGNRTDQAQGELMSATIAPSPIKPP